MRRVEMVNGAVAIPGEDRNRGILIALSIFSSKIVFERAISGPRQEVFAFVENDAQQCGFCTPGFVMSCAAYLETHRNPTIEEVKQALGGNLCRCGTYIGVRSAVVEAAMSMKGGRA